MYLRSWNERPVGGQPDCCEAGKENSVLRNGRGASAQLKAPTSTTDFAWALVYIAEFMSRCEKELICVFEDYSEGDRTAQPQRIETLVSLVRQIMLRTTSLNKRAKKNHPASRKMKK
jgi:hypothetical protein